MLKALSLSLAIVVTGTAAPETFRVRLDTTKGAIILDCVRAWSPHGADRF